MADGQPRILFEPGRVRVGVRGVGGIKVGGGKGPPTGGPGPPGVGPGGRGRGRGGGNSFGQLVSAFGAIAAATSQGVPSPPAVSALTLICSSSLSGTQASFDTNTILGGNLPTTYTHLMAIVYARWSTATDANIQLRFNNDSGTNYGYEVLNASGAAVASTGNINQAAISMGIIPGNTAPAGMPGVCRIDIPVYNGTTFNKKSLSHTHSQYSGGGLQDNNFVGGTWNNTAAITRITILPSSGSFAAGSVFSLYGLS